tara:strand:+ start:525 stop:698 length:174 start_codon:yes stop_codon:yes gene_type:complete
MSKSSKENINEKLYVSTCPICDKQMEYTGLPDIAGEIQFRFYECLEHGVFKVYEKSR